MPVVSWFLIIWSIAFSFLSLKMPSVEHPDHMTTPVIELKVFSYYQPVQAEPEMTIYFYHNNRVRLDMGLYGGDAHSYTASFNTQEYRQFISVSAIRKLPENPNFCLQEISKIDGRVYRIQLLKKFSSPAGAALDKNACHQVEDQSSVRELVNQLMQRSNWRPVAKKQ